MSNMLHACSIFYRMQLPLVVVFNKIDIASHEFAVEWMTDYDAFQDALAEEKDQSYMTSLIRSMSLGLDEFYETLETVGANPRIRGNIRNEVKDIFGNKKNDPRFSS